MCIDYFPLYAYRPSLFPFCSEMCALLSSRRLVPLGREGTTGCFAQVWEGKCESLFGLFCFVPWQAWQRGSFHRRSGKGRPAGLAQGRRKRMVRSVFFDCICSGDVTTFAGNFASGSHSGQWTLWNIAAFFQRPPRPANRCLDYLVYSPPCLRGAFQASRFQRDKRQQQEYVVEEHDGSCLHPLPSCLCSFLGASSCWCTTKAGTNHGDSRLGPVGCLPTVTLCTLSHTVRNTQARGPGVHRSKIAPPLTPPSLSRSLAPSTHLHTRPVFPKN